MFIDLNPKFGTDFRNASNARKVADMLWGVTGGDFTKVPPSYMNQMGFEYSDGSISLLDQLNKVEFSEGTYQEFSDVVDHLIRVDSEDWPDRDSILSIQSEKLLKDTGIDFRESAGFDFSYAEKRDMSRKMELFFRKVISSVYTDGVTSVTDKNGNPPNAQNNYLMAPDGKSFSGIFYDSNNEVKPKKFSFNIKENSDGNWEISY
jgi:hypothetical protein